ncbi:WASH complex subunit 4 [Planococcus citri]|uniref:WASH complex subunit 4 n=1 Tax=Planococcus citri TaxID=170843 RepID=UPI0031F84F5F
MVYVTIEKSIEEDTQRAAAEVQLQKYGQFFDEFSSRIRQLSTTLGDSMIHHRRRYINADFQPKEQIDSVQELINSENKIIDKVLAVFCTLCDEVTYLESEARVKYLGPILYYGSGLPDNPSIEESQFLLSKTLPLLQDLSNFLKHCERLVFDIISQLSAFYRLHFEIADASVFTVFDSLADLLLVMILLEEVLINNQDLIYHWTLYQRTIQLASCSASEIVYDVGKLRRLDQLVNRLEKHLLTKKIFQTVLNGNFDKKVPVKINKRLEEEFFNYLKTLLSDVDRTVNREGCTNMTKLAKLSVMFVLHVNIYGSYDKKFLKTFSEILKKYSLVTLRYNVLLQLDTFTLQYIGQLLKPAEKKLFEKNQPQYAETYLADVTQRMNRDVNFYTGEILSWMLRLEVKLHEDTSFANGTNVQYLAEICSLLVDGINYVVQIKALLALVSNLHIKTKKPMYKTSAVSFCRLVELIKCIESVYRRHHSAIFKSLNYIVQYLLHQCLTIIGTVKKSVAASDKRFKEIRVDAISSIVIAENSLSGPPTKLRQQIVALCLNLASQLKTMLQDTDRQKLNGLLSKITLCTSLLRSLADVTECKFMYRDIGALPVYLEDISTRYLSPNRIQYVLDALENSKTALRAQFEDLGLPNNVTNEVLEQFTDHVVAPNCAKMEENLRLHALHHLQLGKRTLAKVNNDLIHFSRLDRMRFGDASLDVRFAVESYLDRTFYDLTTVALHDWQIYGEMRTLAKRKFQLELMTDDALPNHTLEQGPDLLEITRNLGTFVATNFYNLNNQIFIEACSNNKHLNTINIKHTTNSIRTHGAGIMSTAVNYTYQFLCSKLRVFSQFLYDEQVKSRLLKDISFFNEQSSSNVKFPYDRAERFNRGIRKLGINAEGQTCLDQFRQLISQIGNALGYVRLIRSGGLRYFSNACSFIPNLKEIVDFQELSATEPFSPACQQAAVNLNNVVTNMSRNIAEGTNYFKLLVDVFSSIVEDPKNDHLKNFYAVIPALTINFVEYSIGAKEGLSKKNTKTTVTFTDDGFAVGVAYFLQTLKQSAHFDSFQWFQSVNEKFEAIKADLTTQIANISKDDLKLNHTLSLSLKRADTYQKEFKLLYYNLYSARVLFQGQNKPQTEQEAQDE